MTATRLDDAPARPTARDSWTRSQLAWIVVIVAVSMLATLWFTRLPNVSPDTGQVIAGSDVIVGCLGDGRFTRCGTSPDGTQTTVGPFPLLQHAPDLAAKALGLSASQRIFALSYLSIVAFAGMLLAAWRTFRALGMDAWWPLFVLVALTSPLLYYGNSTWGEMLAAFLLVAFVSTALLPERPLFIGVAAFAATLTKETAFPFVLALGALALLLARRRGALALRPHAAAMTAGVAAGVVATALFNVLRFGTPFNEYYLQERFRVDSLAQRAEFLAGLLVALNAGLVLFWTSACVLLTVLVVVPLAQRARGHSVSILPAGALVVIAGALVV